MDVNVDDTADLRAQIARLLDDGDELDTEGKPIASAYLDFRIEGAEARQIERPHFEEGLQRMIDRPLKALGAAGRSTGDPEADCEQIRRAAQEHRHDDLTGLAVFSAADRGLLRVLALDFPVEAQLVVGEAPWLLPLWEPRVSYPELLLAVVTTPEVWIGRTHAGVVTALETCRRQRDPQDDDFTSDKATMTTKNRASGDKHEKLRVAEDDALLRGAAERLGQAWQPGHTRGAVLFGTPELTAALRRSLPRRITGPITEVAGDGIPERAEDLLPRLEPVLVDWRRLEERRALDDLEGRLREDYRVVTGADVVLQAAQIGRVVHLIVGRDRIGWSEPDSPLACGEPRPAYLKLQQILKIVRRQGASITILEARDDKDLSDPLEGRGGVAALLRDDG